MGAGATEEPASHTAGRAAEITGKGRIAPTLHQRELGTLLRSLRAERGLTVEEVAETLLCPPSRIRQLEAAADLPTRRDLHEFRALFKLDDATADHLADLARKAQQRGWWAEIDLDLPYIGLEEHASSITSYTMWYFPALLQTGAYARAVITAIAPGMDPIVREQRIEARLRRQRVLSAESPMHYAVLLDEAVLHRPVGGEAVMRDQLDNVLSRAREEGATVQVVPFNIGAHAALDSNFVLLEFDEPGPAPAVYVEGLAASHYLERKEDVDRYREAIKYLRKAALDLEDSMQLITLARNSYKSG